MDWTTDRIGALRAGRPRHSNPVQRDTITWLRTGAETGGDHGVLRVEVEPGGEVLAHDHERFGCACTFSRAPCGSRWATSCGTLVRAARQPCRSSTCSGGRTPAGHRPGSSSRCAPPTRASRRGRWSCTASPGTVLYGLARDEPTRGDGRPRSLLRTALLMQWADIHLPGVYRWLGPLVRGLAAHGRCRGIDRELEHRYCR